RAGAFVGQNWDEQEGALLVGGRAREREIDFRLDPVHDAAGADINDKGGRLLDRLGDLRLLRKLKGRHAAVARTTRNWRSFREGRQSMIAARGEATRKRPREIEFCVTENRTFACQSPDCVLCLFYR